MEGCDGSLVPDGHENMSASDRSALQVVREGEKIICENEAELKEEKIKSKEIINELVELKERGKNESRKH